MILFFAAALVCILECMYIGIVNRVLFSAIFGIAAFLMAAVFWAMENTKKFRLVALLFIGILVGFALVALWLHVIYGAYFCNYLCSMLEALLLAGLAATYFLKARS